MQSQATIYKAIAEQWTGKPCYLDGAPAKITGRLNGIATVSPLNPSVPSAEFAWHTVDRVMRYRGGFFNA